MSFRLVKWYGDLTTQIGEAVILYAADLKDPLPVHYASVLDASGHRPAFNHSLHASTIEYDGGGWVWKAPGVEARFSPLHRAAPIDLLDDAPGALLWHAMAPLCKTGMVLRGRHLDGLGYLERLELTVPPWQLPLGRLIWGRLVHPEASLVWIDWQGPRSLRLVLHDGERVEGTIDADTVSGPGFQLQIGHRKVLREGTLGRVALAGIAVVSRVAPAGFLATTERKTLARARLTRGADVLQGWVIDEVVTWER